MYDSTHPQIITSNRLHSNKSVVLSFDDGPSKVLPQILDILKQENVQAMFFWQSRLLYPARPWQRVLDEGHIIGTHSMKHRNLVQLSYEEQYQDIRNSVQRIEKTTGTPVVHFRPPYGRFNSHTLKAAQALGLTTVMWRIASMDWELKDDPGQIIRYATENLEDGAIILLHELEQTVAVLPQLIKTIKEQGYSFSLLPSENK
ncbi:polysaccharide deacetylase family protein [Planococcus sp. SE5232]|uniref:polysaccharide deacetylase family protein n=1 Tax=unclassified Planococcus (in: firmicutes) TaxID=2662419 RepID=UPI001CBDDB6F|nr:polysaccharide deacetylase family protein [Planococcus sp. 4-30]